MSIRVFRNILTPDEIKRIKDDLEKVEWASGKDTAHGAAKEVKNNSQAVKPSPELTMINEYIVSALRRSPMVQKLVMPTEILYPMLNRHVAGESYGKHVDRPLRLLSRSNRYVRCDVSCTVFLSDPSTYEGGRLMIHNGDVTQKVKLNSGDAVVYPNSFVHEVEPVGSGERVCAVTWMQSAIKDELERDIVGDAYILSNTLGGVTADRDIKTLSSNIYNNLMRKWAEV